MVIISRRILCYVFERYFTNKHVSIVNISICHNYKILYSLTNMTHVLVRTDQIELGEWGEAEIQLISAKADAEARAELGNRMNVG